MQPFTVVMAFVVPSGPAVTVYMAETADIVSETHTMSPPGTFRYENVTPVAV